MAKKSNENMDNMGKAIAAGVTVAALTAAGYILLGPEGKKNRRKISGWAVKMKGEIIEKFEQAKELTEPIYQGIVDEVAKKYRAQKEVNSRELNELVADMKKRWKDMVKDAKSVAKKQKTKKRS